MSLVFQMKSLVLLALLSMGRASQVILFEGDADEASVETEPSEAVNLQDVFEAKPEWQEVRPGQVLPSGLHYRLNLATGKKEAKLLEDTPQKASIAKIDDDGQPLASGPAKLRSYKDLQDELAQNKMRLNTEFELVDTLIHTFGNSSLEGQLRILDDLEYFLHQVDNARDFVFVGGLEKIIQPALDSPDHPSMRSSGARVIAASVQSHPQVQEKLLNQGWMLKLLRKLDEESVLSVQSSLVHAIACLVRGLDRSLQEFVAHRGQEQLTRLLETTSSSKLKLKILTFFSDLNRGGSLSSFQEEMPRICAQAGDLVEKTLSPQRLDVFERLVEIATTFAQPCESHLLQVAKLTQIRQEFHAKNRDDELEMEHVLEDLDALIGHLAIPRKEL